MNWRIFHLSN